MSAISNAIKAYFAIRVPAAVGGATRLSSLSLTPGAPLTISAGMTLLVDKAMNDAEYIGYIDNYGTIQFDSTMAGVRLLTYGIRSYDGASVKLGTQASPYANEGGKLHLCAPPFTVSGNAGGGPVVKGFTHDLTTDVATGNNGGTNDYGGISRGFSFENGAACEMYCTRAPIQARLAAAVVAGQTTITVDRLVTMPAGAEVIVATDGFYNTATRSEVRTLAVAAVNTNTLTLNAALTFARFGRNQYMTDNGASLTADAFTLKTVSNPTGMKTDAAMTALLETAAFVTISLPNFEIAAYDLPGQNYIAASGHGFNGMKMGLRGNCLLTNVGMRNYGQLGLLGRYAWHFHVNSWNADGTAKTDGYLGTNKFAPGQAVLNGCVGMIGHNRFAVLHAVLGAEYRNCISYRSKGHPFLYEDGSEQENVMDGNLAIGFEDPGTGNRLKTHDKAPNVDLGVQSQSIVGYWLSNPFNTNRNNWAVDSVGGPFINAHSFGLGRDVVTSPLADLQRGCLGYSINVPIAPAFGKMGIWDGNSGMSCAQFAFSNGGVTNNSGLKTRDIEKLRITSDGVAFNGSGSAPNEVSNGMTLDNARLFKCLGYNNVVSSPNYQRWKLVDLLISGFSGITNSGRALSPLHIRQSLNHESNYLAAIRTMCFAAYHGTMQFINVCADGFTGAVYTIDGGNHGAVQNIAVQETWEEYDSPVLDYHINNTGWAMRNSRGVWQVPPQHVVFQTTTYDYIVGADPLGPGKAMLDRKHTLGVMFDANGFLTTGPTQAGQPNCHVMLNQPYYTTGITVTPLQGNPESCWTTIPFVGLDLDGAPYKDVRNVVQRTTSAGVPIAGALLDIQAGAGYSVLGQRNYAFIIGGFTTWTWPGSAVPATRISGSEYCAGTGNKWVKANPYLNTATDVSHIGISWAGATAVFRDISNTRAYVADVTITSLATLTASSGNKLWLDTANQRCWIKKRPGSSGYQWSLDLT